MSVIRPTEDDVSDDDRVRTVGGSVVRRRVLRLYCCLFLKPIATVLSLLQSWKYEVSDQGGLMSVSQHA